MCFFTCQSGDITKNFKVMSLNSRVISFNCNVISLFKKEFVEVETNNHLKFQCEIEILLHTFSYSNA